MGWVGANQALHVGRGMGQFARIQERTLTLLAPNLGATRLASLTFSLARTTGTSWEEVRFDLARPGSATSQQKGGVRAWLDSWRLGENAPVRTAEATIAAQRTSQQTPVLPSLCQVTLRSAAGKEIPGRITAGRPDEEGYQVLALFASIPVDFKPMDILFRFPVRADTKKIDVVFEDVPLP